MNDSSGYCIGVDFGTDSVRALVVDVYNGIEIASAVSYYPRWAKGMYCEPSSSQFRQHPLDYLESMEECVKNALSACKSEVVNSIKGIGVDTTGSTPCAVDKSGIPLAMKEVFAENPNAMFVLWKDHSSNDMAEKINQQAHCGKYKDYTKYEGGIYSSEWFWAKVAHITNKDKHIRDAAFSWVEHCDWIPAVLTGNTDPLKLKRSRCAAGHKAMWHPEWGGLPSPDFLGAIESHLPNLLPNLFTTTYTSNEPAGMLSEEWQRKWGLPASVTICVGAFDAHMGAVGAQMEPYYLSKVIGTSTCDMLVAPIQDVGSKCVKGICGQVDGSILPGMMGLEAGQSAYGDFYAWFRNILLWPYQQMGISEEKLGEIKNRLIPLLSKSAEAIPVTESDIVALDWINGRRTPDANHHMQAALTGLNLGTTAPMLFKSIVEATAFGSKNIVNRFKDEGIQIKGVIALGGVAKKSMFAMQVLADVLQMPIKVARSQHACALGAAMFASVAAKAHSSIDEAQKAMGAGFERIHQPNKDKAKVYQVLFERYLSLGEFVENNTHKDHV